MRPTFKERMLLSGLNGPYNRIAHLVEKREQGIQVHYVTKQEKEYLTDYLRLSKSKTYDKVRLCNSKHLSKKVVKIVTQLAKLPIKND
jgi:hypothetical protein